ncbi:hypothetical protein ACA910_020920 [Epithemia clementina (nom. ined.)]
MSSPNDTVISTHPPSQAIASPKLMEEDRNGLEWIVSFGFSMLPITAFGYIHSRGWTGHVVEAVVKSPIGVYGLLALPFCTLAMEKCIYDTTQAAQGINPNFRPEDRGGFPSGGAHLPSLSLLPVRKIISFRSSAPSES